ncbi:MAG: hypothetical protein COW08_09875 [Ignavibacteriales bacterium CG12_big_fil_rev_8_21_14_0_65_30_8]|nr:MAG: hypothetical protein COW08_09875 [Ignavibacteriales bacterium CG12_big_fil_rev_8_21_14_0_65_30_8]
MLIKTISKIKKNKYLYLILIFYILVISSQGCKTKVDNRVTFNNLSTTDLIINFRGEAITVSVGQKADITEIQQGTYSYATSFNLPIGATSSTTFGDVTGSVLIKADTKVNVIYTSTIKDGIFTLSATLTTSEDQSTPTSP